jgi:DNA-binding CsgD family transcriptional regulator
MATSGSATLDDLVAQLLIQARATNRLLVALLRDDMSQTELVDLLTAGGGIPVREIAGMLGTTTATVAVTLQRLRKKKSSATRGIRPGSGSGADD